MTTGESSPGLALLYWFLLTVLPRNLRGPRRSLNSHTVCTAGDVNGSANQAHGRGMSTNLSDPNAFEPCNPGGYQSSTRHLRAFVLAFDPLSPYRRSPKRGTCAGTRILGTAAFHFTSGHRDYHWASTSEVPALIWSARPPAGARLCAAGHKPFAMDSPNCSWRGQYRAMRTRGGARE